MPSYRLRLEIGEMRRSADPADVVPACERAARELTYVESSDVDVSGGAAWVQVRVTVEESSQLEEDTTAWATLDAMREALASQAETRRGYVLRRMHAGRWLPVPDRPSDPWTGQIL